MARYTVTRRVEFCETDLAGIVHFANYYRFMEQAEHELFRHLGLKIHGTFPDGTPYGWPRVAASCSFLAPATYDDVLEVEVTILRRSSRSLTTGYRVRRGATVLAEGEMKTAFCRIPVGGKLESAELPAEIAAVLDDFAQRPELDP